MLCYFDAKKQKYHCGTRHSFPCLLTKNLIELRHPQPSIMCVKLFSYNSSSFTDSFILVSWQSRFNVAHLLLGFSSLSVVLFFRFTAFLLVFSFSLGFTLWYVLSCVSVWLWHRKSQSKSWKPKISSKYSSFLSGTTCALNFMHCLLLELYIFMFIDSAISVTWEERNHFHSLPTEV